MRFVVLGPEGTYSDIAAKKYISDNNLKCDIIYVPSILFISLELEKADMAIFPFENTLDGFVLESLDNIVKYDFKIVNQLKLDIDFVFVSNAKSIDDVKNIYCQFKVYGQCMNFITEKKVLATKTESNTETLAKILEEKDNTYGAIIPMHLLEEDKFNIVIKHIADSRYNQTRFFIVQKNFVIEEIKDFDASLVITINHDRVGALYDILSVFHTLDINLNSILSRPARTKLGVYNFYIECKLKNRNMLYELIKKIEEMDFIVTILGVYNKL